MIASGVLTAFRQPARFNAILLGFLRRHPVPGWQAASWGRVRVWRGTHRERPAQQRSCSWLTPWVFRGRP